MGARGRAAAIECDVFCRVVDNFGDAAVAWRLARILSREHGYRVRLLIDQPGVLARLLQRDASQVLPWRVEDVTIDLFDRSRASGAALLIETFGCGLPQGFMAARPAGASAPVLINVEYLSAEEWPAGVHGLSSPARGDLPTRHFFFPGFSPETGGLLRETDHSARRIELQGDPRAAAALWQRFGLEPSAPELASTQRVSMFCYDKGFDEQWLQSLVSHGRRPLHLILAEGIMSRQVSAFCGSNVVGTSHQQGGLRVSVVPFLLQDDYDLLLAACHGNVVRGEDSFVRAQLAGRPLLWDIYPQDEYAHLDKQRAFVNRYCNSWPRKSRDDYLELSSALVERSTFLPAYFRRWSDQLDQLEPLAKDWLRQVESLPELGTQLAIFAEKLLK